MSDLSGCQSWLQLCSCCSNSALQVSCTGYCSVSSHCLADIVEGAFLLISMVLSLVVALFFFDACAVAVPAASFVAVVVAGTVAVLLLLLYCFSNLAFTCLHPG